MRAPRQILSRSSGRSAVAFSNVDDGNFKAPGASIQERQIYDEVCTSRSISPLDYAKQTQFPAAKLE